MAKKKVVIRNNPSALAEHFNTTDPVECFDMAKAAGWEDTVRHTLFRHICHKGTPEQLNAMIERGMPLDEDIRLFLNLSPLHCASQRGNTVLIRHMVKKWGVPIDISLEGTLDTPLSTACKNLQMKSLNTLIELGATLTPNLYRDALYGHYNADDKKQHKIARLWNVLYKQGVALDDGTSQPLGFLVLPRKHAILEAWLDQHHYSWPWLDQDGRALDTMVSEESEKARARAKVIGVQTQINGPSKTVRRM